MSATAKSARGESAKGKSATRKIGAAFLTTLLLSALAGCGPAPQDADAPLFEARDWQPTGGPATRKAEQTEPRCSHYTEDRLAFFGDLHVHTSFSLDAYTRGGLQTPDDAYRFAKGETIGLAPYDRDGRPTRQVQLARPLDFAAVTDHAEWIGELGSCRDDRSPAFASTDCKILRGELAVEPSARAALISKFNRGHQRRPDGICGADASLCRTYAGDAWQRTQAAAQRHQDDSSACRFTTFNAWEYSALPGLSKVHRNVILRNDSVPELPISWLEEPSVESLWEKLLARCNDTDTGCEALTIPHNPNISNGQMFTVTYRDEPMSAQRKRAELQARMEPLVEMMQSKGESECRSGLYDVFGQDEQCGFEKVRFQAPPNQGQPPEDCAEGTGAGAIIGQGCQSRLDFARYGLMEGLREHQRIGVNPYHLGFVGGTDTHNATPGATEEVGYVGHNSTVDDTPAERLSKSAYAPHPLRNPGGLMGVWAEQNSRDALFDAMQRRETFATSGVRIKPRLFAGWSLSKDLCDQPDAVSRADNGGVAMGSILPHRGEASERGGPLFYASAIRDFGSDSHPGNGLQRVQIIKGDIDDQGRFRQRVYDIATDPDGTATVDESCEPDRSGAANLCAVWQDPEWRADTNAFYYARVLEQPSCRWSTRQCRALPADQRPPACTDGSLPETIQERAWTSAIWYYGN